MKKIDKIKEIYRLWWEYLICTDGYRKLCGKFELPKHAGNSDKNGLDAKASSNTLQYFWSLLDCQFTPGNWSLENEEAVAFLRKVTFDIWWNYYKPQLANKETRHNSIRNYADFVEEDIELIINMFKERSGKEPSLQEFKDYFTGKIRQDDLLMYLCVSPQGKTVDTLQKELGEIIGKRRKDPILKKLDLAKRAFEEPTVILPAKDIKALKGYLEIWKLRNDGLHWKEIFIKNLSTNAYKKYQRGNRYEQKGMYDDARSGIMKSNSKALKILKNVDVGIFPGDYQ